MVTVAVKVTLVNTNDPNTRYFSLSIDNAITDWWQQWPRPLVIVSPSYNIGQTIFSSNYNLSSGRHTIYYAVSVSTANFWKFKIRIENKDTGALIAEFEDTLDNTAPIKSRYFDVGAVSVEYVSLSYEVSSGGTLNVAYGDVYRNLSGPTSGVLTIPKNVMVTIECVPSSGYYLKNLVINGVTYTSTRVVKSFDSSGYVTVVFGSSPTPPSGKYTLTYTISEGGKAKINGVEYSGSGHLYFDSGTSVTVVAVPNSGYLVKNINLDGTVYNRTDVTFVMNTNRSVSILFEPEKTSVTDTSRTFENFEKMMSEQFMPMMLNITMMVLMINMMVGMMSGLVGALG